MSRASPSAPTAADICAAPPPPLPPPSSAAYSKNPFDDVPDSTVADGVDEILELNPAANRSAGNDSQPQSSSTVPTSRAASGGAGSRLMKASSSSSSLTGRQGGATGDRPTGSKIIDDDDGDRKSGCCHRPCCQRCFDCCFRCTARCTRVLLVVPNVIFLLFGATLVGLGVWMRADRESSFYLLILQHVPASPILSVDQIPVAIIAVGSCVAVLSFLGCCGACFESACFLCLYALLLVLMVMAEVAIGVVVAVMREELLLKFTESLQHQIRYDYNRTNPLPIGSPSVPPKPFPVYPAKLTTAWDDMQNRFECCGAVGPEDYRNSTWSTQSGRDAQVPASCCYQPSSSSSVDSQTQDCRAAYRNYIKMVDHPGSVAHDPRMTSGLKTQGCKQSLVDQMKRHVYVLVGAVSGAVLLQSPIKFVAIFTSLLYFVFVGFGFGVKEYAVDFSVVGAVDFGFACVLMNWFRKKQAECSWYDDDDFD